MALSLNLDSLTRSVSEGILGENKQPKPLADASGYKVSTIGLTPLPGLISSRAKSIGTFLSRIFVKQRL